MSDTTTALPGRRVYAVAAISAPIALLLSDVAYVTASGSINDGVVGGTIGVWSAFLVGLALLGISRSMEPVSPRAATALMAMAVPAACGIAAFNVNALYVDQFGNDFPNAVIDDGSSAFGLLAFLPWGWFGPLSLVLAGVLVWRTALYPRWCGALVAVGGVLIVVSRPAVINPLAIGADVVLVLGLVPIGLAVLAGVRPQSSAELPALR